MIDYGSIFLYGFSTGMGVVFAQEFYNHFLKRITTKIFDKIRKGELFPPDKKT